MQNDPSAPSVPPSKGFASILSLVSDVSQALAALEQADAAVPPPAPRPRPVRIAPAPVTAGPYVAVAPVPGKQSVPARRSVSAQRSAPVRKPGMSRATKQGIFWLAIIILGTLAFLTCAELDQSQNTRPEQPLRGPQRQSQGTDSPPPLRQWGQH